MSGRQHIARSEALFTARWEVLQRLLLTAQHGDVTDVHVAEAQVVRDAPFQPMGIAGVADCNARRRPLALRLKIAARTFRIQLVLVCAEGERGQHRERFETCDALRSVNNIGRTRQALCSGAVDTDHLVIAPHIRGCSRATELQSGVGQKCMKLNR